jgi:hypothetical protein
VRVRASRKGLFAGQATFGRSASKTEWIYGFKVALVSDPKGVVTLFGVASAACEERPIGEALVAEDRHEGYLADKGFSGIEWERRWRATERWSLRLPKTTTAGHGRRRTVAGPLASDRSSRG